MWYLIFPLIMGLDDMAFAMIIAGVVSAIGSVVGVTMSNSANAKIHEADNAVNISEAEKSREFEQFNANTQYTRAVEDMKNAGLNPMLAVSKGGNAVPSGSAASAAAPISMSNRALLLQF